MLRAHRQAWCWQDEYHGLELSDIRRLEHETQLALRETMAAATDGETECDNKTTNNIIDSSKETQSSPANSVAKQKSLDQVKKSDSQKNLSPSSARHSTRSRSTHISLQSSKSKSSIGRYSVLRVIEIISYLSY